MNFNVHVTPMNSIKNKKMIVTSCEHLAFQLGGGYKLSPDSDSIIFLMI